MTKSAKSVLAIRCSQCGQTSHMHLHNWRCDLCGGAWLPHNEKKLELSRISSSAHNIWRYADWMGLELNQSVKLGAGGTPLVETRFQGHRVFMKTEYQNPSGSFKDRGVEAMLSTLCELSAESVVEDSSGNAGASVAAYAARAGIKAEIFAPETASAFKLAQIELYGAKVTRVPGPRENSTYAVMEAVQSGAVFASHAWNPAYLLGQQTTAWEVWEQLGQCVPHWWVTPSGQGGHLLGIWMGFQRLFQSGLTNQLPRMVVVQSTAVAPLTTAMQKGLEKIEPLPAGRKTIAEGVVVTSPVRWKQILSAARENNWLGFSIAEEEILPARLELAHDGFFVEPTSALAAAALPKLFPYTNKDDLIVVSLTGSGLKVPLA